MQSLLWQNDLNERALANQRYCFNNKEKIDPNFLSHFEETANSLLKACILEFGWSSEYAASQILERHEKSQNNLKKSYADQGCESQAAWKAYQHYIAYSSEELKSEN